MRGFRSKAEVVMTDTLTAICESTRKRTASRADFVSLRELERQTASAAPPRGFISAIRRHGTHSHPALIAEVKKASPSKGLIRADFDPRSIARTYEENGATCLSVLTEPDFFLGQDEDLKEAREACALPVLRKDFMLEPYQIFESRIMGADCVLLIMAALSDADAATLYRTAHDLQMDVLVEVHDLPELERAMKLSPYMIGINNRNLKTLEVDLDTCNELGMLIPGDVVKVAESGIRTNEDILHLLRGGFLACLVGESLMRQNDIGAAMRNLLGTN
ncbi:MAG: indole-3-glycerol phosphate synthase TrpC [Alphaproteobacteria bacterium]|nr:indole-3-glycerol phosphate synthase TrpC [Alphaproteobacteria bacterium]